MSNDDRKPATPDVMTLAPVDTPALPDRIALAEPEPLVQALRSLQPRIPGFTQLTVKEKRSHARAASLDPEFIEAGLHAATVWDRTELLVGRTGDALRDEQVEIERWERVIVEMRALTDGMAAANVKRKHRLGRAILLIYAMLGRTLTAERKDDAHLRPYYENMKRAFLRTRQFRRKKKVK